jgi:hypothetical protein
MKEACDGLLQTLEASQNEITLDQQVKEYTSRNGGSP